MPRLSRYVCAICAILTLSWPAGAGQKDDVIRLYRDFAAAQNARDLAGVRRLLSDSPDFLWVSDGRAVWTADATIARMSSFQKSPVWRVEPALDRARFVALSDDAAMLHVPLVLEIGEAGRTDRLAFLVGMIATKGAEGWRITALLTTADKTGQP